MPRTQKLTYKEWMKKADEIVDAKLGCSIDDLTDVAFLDMYESGKSPAAAAGAAIRASK